MTNEAPALPTPRTPGFALVAPRAFQVLLAVHAQKIAHGHGYVIVEHLANECGCGRNAVGSALTELRDLGWVATKTQRDARGRHAGVHVTLLPPPSELTEAAAYRYAVRLSNRNERMAKDRQRLLDAASPAIRKKITEMLDECASLAMRISQVA